VKVVLFFPPATDPRAPHLALPALAAYLRLNGVETTLRDLDVEGLLAILSPGRLDAAVGRIRSGDGDRIGPDRRAALLSLSDDLSARVQKALRILRDPVRFFDANDFNAARAVIDTAVAIATATAPVDYSLEPIRYDAAGCDPRRLRDLLHVTAQPDRNLFRDFWEEEVLSDVDAAGPDLVGVSLTNRQQLLPGLTLARVLKQRGHFVVLGGSLISKFADDLVRWPEFFEAFADGVVVFEGETALLELVAQLGGGRDFSRVPNYRYLDGHVVRATATHVENVDALPTPDFEGLPLRDYLTPHPVLPILFGKGCYHSRCNFCDIPHINRVSSSRYRRRSPAKILEDVRLIEERTGARHFVVTDESLSPEVLDEVAEAFSALTGRYSFAGYARVERGFTPELCQRAAALGVRKLVFGLESAAQRTLDHMQKGTSIEMAPGVLRACRDAGIRFHLFGMIGLPEEDEGSARETLAFFLEHRDLIDDPGNSFDIHRFGLDVRSRYFADRDRHGLLLGPGVLDRELAVGLGHDDWRNSRGLSSQRVEQLLSEFREVLRRTFRAYHNSPRHLWPPFEEHAVLYGDYYRTRPFPYRSALPDSGDGRAFRLRVSPACSVLPNGEDVEFTSYWNTVKVPASLARVLMDTRVRTLAHLVSECADLPSEAAARAGDVVHEAVSLLIAAGVIQFVWADADAPVVNGPTPHGAVS